MIYGGDVNEDLRARAAGLAEELKRILEENLAKDPGLTDAAMARAREIRDEIQQMGFLMTWGAKLNPITLEISVDVTLYEPKKNLLPDEQKIYDEWFARVNKFNW